MRFALLLLLALPTAVLAQPERDEAGIAALFTRMVDLAHADSVAAAMDLMACPIETGEGRPVPGRCAWEEIAHRIRAETQLATLARLFPEGGLAHPHYGAEGEGDMDFHLLLFDELEAAPYALLSFTDLDGEHVFIEAQLDEPLTGLRAPSVLVMAFDILASAVMDPATTAEDFAPRTAARHGSDRAWTVPGDASFEEDRQFATGALHRLRALLAPDGRYAIAGFEWDRESEGTWYVLHVRFGDEDETTALAFLPIGDALLLGDID